MPDIRCPKCGKINPAGVQNCVYCGAMIHVAKEKDVPAPPPPDNTTQPGLPSSSWLDDLRSTSTNGFSKNGDADTAQESRIRGGTDFLTRLTGMDKADPHDEKKGDQDQGNVPGQPLDLFHGFTGTQEDWAPENLSDGGLDLESFWKIQDKADEDNNRPGDRTAPCSPGENLTDEKLSGSPKSADSSRPSAPVTASAADGGQGDDNLSWIEQLKSWHGDELPPVDLPSPFRLPDGVDLTAFEEGIEVEQPADEDDNHDWLKQFDGGVFSAPENENHETGSEEATAEPGAGEWNAGNDPETSQWLERLGGGEPKKSSAEPDEQPIASSPIEISPEPLAATARDEVIAEVPASAKAPDRKSGSGLSGTDEGKMLPDWLSSLEVPSGKPPVASTEAEGVKSAPENDDMPGWLKGFTSNLPKLKVEPENQPPVPLETLLPDWLSQTPRAEERVLPDQESASAPEQAEPSNGSVDGLEKMGTYFHHGVELPYWLADIYPPDSPRNT